MYKAVVTGIALNTTIKGHAERVRGKTYYVSARGGVVLLPGGIEATFESRQEAIEIAAIMCLNGQGFHSQRV